MATSTKAGRSRDRLRVSPSTRISTSEAHGQVRRFVEFLTALGMALMSLTSQELMPRAEAQLPPDYRSDPSASSDLSSLEAAGQIPSAILEGRVDDPSPSFRVTDELNARTLRQAQEISDPFDRTLSLALVALARINEADFPPESATIQDIVDDLKVAREAMDLSLEAAQEIDDPLDRDRALERVAEVLNVLGVSLVRTTNTVDSIGSSTLGLFEPSEDLPDTEPVIEELLAGAQSVFEMAGQAASGLREPTVRNEILTRLVSSVAEQSRNLAQSLGTVRRSLYDESELDLDDIFGDSDLQSPPPEADEVDAEASQIDPQQRAEGYRRQADQLLILAVELTQQMTRPVWRDQALVEIVIQAAQSDQFARAYVVAMAIPEPSVRADALVRLAATLARDLRNESATVTYQAAAEAAVRITQTDKRDVILAVLIDSLVTTGRFVDARLCTPLLSNETRRVLALGAIAEAQGRNGLIDSALEWLNQQDPNLQPELRRRLLFGIYQAISNERSRSTQALDSIPLEEDVPSFDNL